MVKAEEEAAFKTMPGGKGERGDFGWVGEKLHACKKKSKEKRTIRAGLAHQRSPKGSVRLFELPVSLPFPAGPCGGVNPIPK